MNALCVCAVPGGVCHKLALPSPPNRPLPFIQDSPAAASTPALADQWLAAPSPASASMRVVGRSTRPRFWPLPPPSTRMPPPHPRQALPLDSILAQCVEALRSAAPGVRRAAAELLVHLHATSDAQALRQVEVGLAQQPPVPAAIEADVQAAFLQALSEHSKLAS
eukprot:scaffold9729_cov108-Isochrysis_galbana.AAC.3